MMKRTTKNALLGAAIVGSLVAAPLALSAGAQPDGRRGFRGHRRGHAPGALLGNSLGVQWDHELPEMTNPVAGRFVKVMPVDYRRR